ncbi:uncharacterized protein BXZ73DRAFT_43009 [Epithele typhae]|uniref:uncharacterized protein n=1 Tax=Epithele typhae TaxID=378194 RepID=UPI002007F082|nr:uncharacterized protein BXZ73DRAFT_43009 [Epithele typhae]KAH9940219.1 hypothetical protein BXZ73DRAFT_43009 [Epithele typhae]
MAGRVHPGAQRHPTNLDPTAEFVARVTRWWNDPTGRHVQRSWKPAGQSDEDEVEPAHARVVFHSRLIGTLMTALLGSRKVRAGRGAMLVGRCFNVSILVFELNGWEKGALVSDTDTTHLDRERNGDS